MKGSQSTNIQNVISVVGNWVISVGRMKNSEFGWISLQWSRRCRKELVCASVFCPDAFVINEDEWMYAPSWLSIASVHLISLVSLSHNRKLINYGDMVSVPFSNKLEHDGSLYSNSTEADVQMHLTYCVWRDLQECLFCIRKNFSIWKKTANGGERVSKASNYGKSQLQCPSEISPPPRQSTGCKWRYETMGDKKCLWRILLSCTRWEGELEFCFSGQTGDT